MDNIPSKPWYKSETLQGQIVESLSLIVFLLKLCGLAIPIVTSEIGLVVGAIGTIAGIIMTIRGRLKAQQPIAGWEHYGRM